MRLAQSLEELLIFVKAEKADTVVADPPPRGSAYSERARHDKSHTLRVGAVVGVSTHGRAMGGNNRSSVSPVVGSESVRLGVLSGAPDPHDFDTSSSVFSVLFTAKLGGDDTTETVPLNRLWVSSNPTVEQLDSNQKELLDALLSSDPASTLDILQKGAHQDARQQAAESRRVAREDNAARKGGPGTALPSADPPSSQEACDAEAPCVVCICNNDVCEGTRVRRQQRGASGAELNHNED
jgi:hypothetical protein